MDVSQDARLTWPWAVGIVLAIVLLPLPIWGEGLDEHAATVAAGTSVGVVAALAIAGLLVADVVLPVPSSIVMVAAGAQFGLVAGTALAWIAATAGCVLAYAAGRSVGPPLVRRWVGQDAEERATRRLGRNGPLALAACRPVPVLAEASVILAGATRMAFAPFLVAVAASNLVVAGMCAWAGSRGAASLPGPVPALAVLLALALLPVMWSVGRDAVVRGR